MRPGSHARRKRVRPFALITLSLLLLLFTCNLSSIISSPSRHHQISLNQPQQQRRTPYPGALSLFLAIARSLFGQNPASQLIPSPCFLPWTISLIGSLSITLPRSQSRTASTTLDPPRRKPFCPPPRIRTHALCYGGDAACSGR